MKIFRNIILIPIFFILLSVQSCMIAHYQVRNELKSDTKKTINDECDIKYTLSLGRGYKGYEENIINQIKSDHISFAMEVFNGYGCNAKYVENVSEANFFIEIQEPMFMGASGQDYLNAFSFGLIPSWETRETKIFIFYDKKINVKNTYHIDTKNYNHLIFLPFSWTMFITLGEEKIFKKSLRNFIENS